MTKGKPLPIMMRFCIPVLIGILFQQLYNVADTIIVAQFIGAEEPLAAVGTTGSLNFLVLGFVIGICNGFCIPISQRFGAGDIKEMRRFAANAVYLCVFFAVVLTALTMLFTRQLLIMMAVPEDIIDLAYSYIIMVFAGIPAAMAYNILACMLRALGDSKAPLYFLAIASVVNIIADLIFIIPLNMGVMGAGLATVVAQSVAAILCFNYIRKNYPILRLTKEDMKFSMPHSKKLFTMGVPMGLQFTITAIGAVILSRAVNELDDIAVISSIAVGNRISLLFFQPMEALGLTMATYCGQNLGAKMLGRIRHGIRLAMIIQMVYALIAGAVLWFFGRNIAALFVGSGGSDIDATRIPEILDNIKFQLQVLGAGYSTIGILFIFRNSLQGLGYSVVAMLAGVSELVGRVFVAFALVEPFGFAGVCFSGPLSWILADIVLIPIYFRVMKSLKGKLTEQLS